MKSEFKTVDSGWITHRPPQAGAAIAVGSRCACLNDGTIVCSYMHTVGLGTNDFVPQLAESRDGGKTWQERGPVWPELASRWSIFASISRDLDGGLYLFGSRTPIDVPGEPFWSDANAGLKQNELIWASSTDGGRTWTSPAVIPMPIPGSAEAPGAMQVLRSGRWLAVYSPYNTFDPALRVERPQVVAMVSDDQGKSWRHTAMLRFPHDDSGGAEAWAVELDDENGGRVLGAGWHMSYTPDREHPDAFAISHDGGATWGPTQSTGILGQSIGLAALPGGRALMVYNQRRHGEVGVWLATCRPTDNDFGLESNQIIWRAAAATQSQTSGEHAEWTDFSFGEPSVTLLPNNRLLVALWTMEREQNGIRFVLLEPSAV